MFLVSGEHRENNYTPLFSCKVHSTLNKLIFRLQFLSKAAHLLEYLTDFPFTCQLNDQIGPTIPATSLVLIPLGWFYFVFVFKQKPAIVFKVCLKLNNRFILNIQNYQGIISEMQHLSREAGTIYKLVICFTEIYHKLWRWQHVLKKQHFVQPQTDRM